MTKIRTLVAALGVAMLATVTPVRALTSEEHSIVKLLAVMSYAGKRCERFEINPAAVLSIIKVSKLDLESADVLNVAREFWSAMPKLFVDQETNGRCMLIYVDMLGPEGVWGKSFPGMWLIRRR